MKNENIEKPEGKRYDGTSGSVLVVGDLREQREEPTSYLRWSNGVLQQKWLITNMIGDGFVSYVESYDEDWRDVPNK